MHALRDTPFLSSPGKQPNTITMVSLESVQATSISMDTISGPRISFSADFLDDNDFISINPLSGTEIREKEHDKARNIDFEFLSEKLASNTMLTADELFFEGKLLPFSQMQHLDKLGNICLKQEEQGEKEISKEESRISWFIDDDPSPRPPKCTVLWKELLRLKKQRASSLSPSSSLSSSSSSNSVLDIGTTDNGKEGKERTWSAEKHVKRIKQGLQRTRSATIRIRPVVNVPICTQAKSNKLPPLFSLRKGNVER